MKKLKKYILLFVLILFPILLQAQENALFLIDSNRIFKQKEVVSLNGKWQFYWKEFINNNSFSHKKPIIVDIPNSWTRYAINDTNLPSTGYGTYYAKIILPKQTIYAIKIKLIYSAYKIWINNELVYQQGILGKNKNEEIPKLGEKVFLYNAQKDTLDIYIEVSNYHYFQSGIIDDIQIAQPYVMYLKTSKKLALEIFILGIFLLFSLFYIVHFANTREFSQLFIVMYIISEGLISLFHGEYIIFKLFTSINFNLIVHIYYIFDFLKLYFFILFVKYLAKEKLTNFFKISFNSIYIFLIAYLISITIETPDNYFWIYKWLTILKVSYSLLMISYLGRLSFIEKNKQALWVLIGLLIIVITGANDYYHTLGYIRTIPNAINYGIVIFVILYSFVVSKQSAEVFELVQNLNNKIKLLNLLKYKLLSIPTYKVHEIFREFISTLQFDRGLLFFITDENLVLEIEVKDNKIIQHNKPIEHLEKDYFDIELVLKSHMTKKLIKYDYEPTYSISTYTKQKKLSSIRAVPLLKRKEKNILAHIYIENYQHKITPLQDEMIIMLSSEFINIIETATTYWKLENMNKKLEQRIKEETFLIEQQKQEIKQKNNELNSKLAQIEKHNHILLELNKELEIKNKILEEQNEEIKQQKEKLEQQKNELNLKNKILTSNIEYAYKIQQLVIRRTEKVPFRDMFLIELPKNIISGDFYYSWWYKDVFIFAVADCTGHGVPGALMSMLAASGLTDILNQYFYNQNIIPQPSTVLDKLRELIINTFNEEEDIKDGLDIALVFYFPKRNRILFSGAYNPIYIFRDNELIELKGDRMPVGYYFKQAMKPFTTKEFFLKDNDIIYSFSDGYADQFGGKNKTKFFIKNLKKLLKQIQAMPFQEQKAILLKVFYQWKNGEPQTDDITILAYKV